MTLWLQYDAVNNNSRAASLWSSVLLKCYPWFAGHSLRFMLVSLLFNQSNYHGLDFIEFSSGRGNLSCELLRQGLVGAAFDIANEDCHDCLTSQGLRLWLDALTATGRAALTWWGTECSSFVILCKCQSCREVSNDFLGDESRPFVRRGNCFMEITALLMLLSFWLGNVCVLEQPLNSVMPRAPSLSHVLAFIQANKYVTYIGAFGGETTEPLQIWSSHSSCAQLCAPGLSLLVCVLPHVMAMADLQVSKDCCKTAVPTPASLGLQLLVRFCAAAPMASKFCHVYRLVRCNE